MRFGSAAAADWSRRVLDFASVITAGNHPQPRGPFSDVPGSSPRLDALVPQNFANVAERRSPTASRHFVTINGGAFFSHVLAHRSELTV